VRKVVIAIAAVIAAAAPIPGGLVGPTFAAPVCDGAWHVATTEDHSEQTGEIDSLNGVASLSSGERWAVGSWEKYPEAYSFHTLVEHSPAAADTWTIVPSPNAAPLNSQLHGVAAIAADDVWAVGGSDDFQTYTTLVEHWDGTNWSIVNSASFPGVLYGVVAFGAADIWAVGSENYPGRGLIEHWNGTTWTATYLRYNALLRGVGGTGPNAIWAVGQRYGRTNPFGDTTLTLRFNGRSWADVRSPNPLSTVDTDQNWLTSVSAVSAKDVWAVGRYGNHDVGPLDSTLVEHWNGSRWLVVPSPNPGGTSVDNDLWGVAAVGSGDVWAVGGVGTFLNPQPSTPLATHWDGTAWSQVTVSTPASGELLGLAGGSSGPSAVGDTVKSAVPSPYVGTLAEQLCPA
jgi:hypothetical protein